VEEEGGGFLVSSRAVLVWVWGGGEFGWGFLGEIKIRNAGVCSSLLPSHGGPPVSDKEN